METEAYFLLSSIGFTWEKGGFERMHLFHSSLKNAWQFTDVESHATAICLFMIIVSPNDVIDEAEAIAWLPSPSTLANMEKNYAFIQLHAHYDLCSFGARAFLRVKRDDDAYELARLAVSPEQGTMKKTTLVTCHSILGQVAAKRGDSDEARGHFTQALEVAKASRLPMLELLAARDWRDHLLVPSGRDCSNAEAVIDSACIVMKKTRLELQRVLQQRSRRTCI